MENEVLSENIYKNIPRLPESSLDVVSNKFQLSEVYDFDPNGDSTGKSVPWGTISKAVLFRDNYSCRICERSSLSNVQSEGRYDKLHLNVQVHHIIPRKDGGKDTFSNLITLCEECHRKTFSNGYAGLPVDGQSTIYNFDYRIKLCVQPSWFVGVKVELFRGELKNYRRVFDQEENVYRIVPSNGNSLKLAIADLTRTEYREIIAELTGEFSINDYTTMKVYSEKGRQNARILLNDRGEYLI